FVVVASTAILVTSRSSGQAPREPLTNVQLLCSTVVVCLLAGATMRKTGVSQEILEQRVAETFPEQAAAVVENRHYSGPLYNHFNWGGYLIWRLPNLPVAIDGRTNIHGVERTKQS